MIKITHSNMCSKSRDSLEMLRESGVDFEIINYLSGELSKYDISNILVKLKMTAEQITRKTETLFKKKFKNNSKDFSEEE
jgi:arsenate reductase